MMSYLLEKLNRNDELIAVHATLFPNQPNFKQAAGVNTSEIPKQLSALLRHLPEVS